MSARTPQLGVGSAMAALLLCACAGSRADVRTPMPDVPANAASSRATLVRFEAKTGDPWRLSSADGGTVCALPCQAWVGPSDDLLLELDPPADPLGPTVLEVPQTYPPEANGRLTLSPDRRHGLGTLGKVLAAPTALAFGAMGLALVVLSASDLGTGAPTATSSTQVCVSGGGCSSSASRGVAADLESIGVGLGLLTVAGLAVVWFFHDRDAGLDSFYAPPAGPSARPSPDEPARSRPPSVSLHATAGGVAARF